MTSLRGNSCVAFLSICWLVASSAFADTISTWNGSTGNWSNSTNWIPASVPNNTPHQSYGVVINSGQPNLDINATVNTMTFGSGGSVYLGGDSAFPYPVYDLTLTVNRGNMNLDNFSGGGLAFPGGIGDSLTFGGNVTNPGGFVMSGALSAAGNFTNSGSMQLLGGNSPSAPGAISVGGTFTNSSTLTFGFGDQPINQFAVGYGHFGSLINKGSIQISLGSSVGVGGSGVTHILTGSSWLVEGAFGGFQNLTKIDGSLNLESPAVMTPRGGTLTNSGTFAIGSSNPPVQNIVAINGNLSNSGNLTVGVSPFPSTPGQGGTLNVSGTLTNQANGMLNLNDLPPGYFGQVALPSQLSAQRLVNYGTATFEYGTTTTLQTLENYGSLIAFEFGNATPTVGTLTTGTFLAAGSLINIGSGGEFVVGSGAVPAGAGGTTNWPTAYWSSPAHRSAGRLHH